MRYLSSPKKVASEIRTLKLTNRNSLVSLAFYLALIISLLYPFFAPKMSGATVTEAFVRFDRLATGAAISGTACMETDTVGTETNVVIDFPSDWTISQTAGDWTVTTTNLPVRPSTGGTATAWPGINTATTVNGVSVVFAGSDLTVDTWYCFNFTGASSTVGPAGNDKTGTLKTQGGAPYVDTVEYATSVVSASADQITVTASVSAQMTFSLDSNSVALGTLSSSSETYDATGITQEVITNARNGWVSWVRSANAGLDSATASDSIDSGSYTSGVGNITDLASVAGYVLDVVPSTGAPTIATEYDGDGNSSGGNLDTNFRQTARGSVPTASDEVTLHVAARASATNAAADDYTDILTVSAAGSF